MKQCYTPKERSEYDKVYYDTHRTRILEAKKRKYRERKEAMTKPSPRVPSKDQQQ